MTMGYIPAASSSRTCAGNRPAAQHPDAWRPACVRIRGSRGLLSNLNMPCGGIRRLISARGRVSDVGRVITCGTAPSRHGSVSNIIAIYRTPYFSYTSRREAPLRALAGMIFTVTFSVRGGSRQAAPRRGYHNAVIIRNTRSPGDTRTPAQSTGRVIDPPRRAHGNRLLDPRCEYGNPSSSIFFTSRTGVDNRASRSPGPRGSREQFAHGAFRFDPPSNYATSPRGGCPPPRSL